MSAEGRQAMAGRTAAVAIVLALALGACAGDGSGTDPLAPPEDEERAVTVPPLKAPRAAVPVAPAPAEEVAPAPAEETEPAPAEETASAPAAETEPAADEDAPHIYMAVQPDRSGPTSVVFAIDRSRDGTPSDEPAIRLTPEYGKCNPQEMRRFNFPPEAAGRPVFGPDESGRGVTAKDLPSFMAVAVTSEMMRRGLIGEPEQSQPQNVCTRKLWERLVAAQSTGQG